MHLSLSKSAIAVIAYINGLFVPYILLWIFHTTTTLDARLISNLVLLITCITSGALCYYADQQGYIVPGPFSSNSNVLIWAGAGLLTNFLLTFLLEFLLFPR